MTTPVARVRTSYWDAYYSEQVAPATPSQFAVFVLDEIADGGPLVVDVGCGSGRDSWFFAQHGVPTLGIDASAAAIATCRSRDPDGRSPVRFMELAVEDPDLLEVVLEQATILGRPDSPIVIYARFFLHAIDEAAQGAFLDWAARLLHLRGGTLALEFRTIRDMNQPKAEGTHYRRFIDPIHAITEAQDRRLRLGYLVEGFGFARFRGEDAHVARCLFRP